MNVNITSTKVEFLSRGTSIVFRGDDLLRGQVIQNPAGQGSIVRLTLSKEARDVAGADFYDISPFGIDNQPTWTDRWEQEGAFTCLDDLTPLFRKCCASGGSGSGIVETIVAGDGIDVDSTDPANPEVSAKVDGTTIGFNGSGELEVLGGPGAAITDLTGDVAATGPGSVAATIQPDVVTNTKLANMAQSTLKGRTAGSGTGDPVDLTANQVSTILDGATDPFVRTSALPGAGIDQLTGDVTAGPGTGSQAATIANGVVTYAKMQNVSATDRLLGRSTAGAGVVEEIPCTAAGRALLDDATAADQRATLALGTASTANTGTGASDVPTITQADARYAPIGNTITSVLTADSTPTSSTSYIDVTGLSITLDANTYYMVRFGGSYQSSSASNGVGISITATNSPTFSLDSARFTSTAGAATPVPMIQSNDGGTISTTVTNANATLNWHLRGYIYTGGSPSVVQIRIARGGAGGGQVFLTRGSHMLAEKVS
jgi:hypothetical protein